MNNKHKETGEGDEETRIQAINLISMNEKNFEITKEQWGEAINQNSSIPNEERKLRGISITQRVSTA
jgi:alkylhydroperoxidase/carboxymuconolactone decarboxylase family protein YurZ